MPISSPAAPSQALPSLRGLVVLIGLVAATAASAQTAVDAVYRFYNRETGTHFYTIVASAERDGVIQAYPQFAYEGAVFAALAQPRADRCRCSASTTRRPARISIRSSASERDGIIAYYPQFAYEGPAFHAMPADGTDGRVAVFRFFNKSTGAHFYTASPAERDKIVATYPHFIYEGIAFYVYPAAERDGRAGAWSARATRGASWTRRRSGRRRRRWPVSSRSASPRYLEEQFAQPMSGYPDGEYSYLSLDESVDVLVRCVAQQPRVHLRARPADAFQVPQPVLRQRDDEARPAPAARGVGAVAVLRGVGHEGPRHGSGLRAGALSQDPVRRGVRQLRERSCGA